VRLLAKRFPGVTFFEATVGAGPIPRPDGAFELVTALDVTYHITDDALWEAAVADVARLVRPGGAVVILDAFGDAERSPADHVRFRSRQRWESVAGAAGLRVDAVVPAYRWLSRDTDVPLLRRLPGTVRGACEYALEKVAPRPPHMRCVRFRRDRA
jgi:SAM-dependent methyltransferase